MGRNARRSNYFGLGGGQTTAHRVSRPHKGPLDHTRGPHEPHKGFPGDVPPPRPEPTLLFSNH
eukprot:5989014-Amphidinium_carterae.1